MHNLIYIVVGIIIRQGLYLSHTKSLEVSGAKGEEEGVRKAKVVGVCDEVAAILG
jgi:hypothetical protein